MVPIQQIASYLLCGEERAICYSGFRRGQHPDRGSGAVDPNDEEVLEDLQILSRDGNFQLIRLYDSQANSESVLRMIKSNRLDMKVLLGAWLEAEMSNPNCPWHPEPYPDEVLRANKVKNFKELDRAIRLANEYPNIVSAVAVGNEALVSWTDHMVPVNSVSAPARKGRSDVTRTCTIGPAR